MVAADPAAGTQEHKFDYEFLSELQRQLQMTSIPDQLDGVTNIQQRLHELAGKFSLLESYGRCSMELFNLGHFAYSEREIVLTVKPQDTVDTLQGAVKDLESKIENWKLADREARGLHYFLNYYTTRELCFMVRNIDDESAWKDVWPLLRKPRKREDQEKTKF